MSSAAVLPTLRRYRLVAALMPFALLAAGCGGDGDDTTAPPAADEIGIDGDGTDLDDAAAAGGADDEGVEDDAADDAETTDDGGAAGDACELLPLADVTALFGQEARVDDSGPTECVWIADGSGLHQLHLQMYTGASYYDPSRWAPSGGSEPIDGIGDESFLVRTSPLGTTAGYLEGEQAVFLNYSIMISGEKPEAKADEVAALLGAIAG